MAQITGDWLPAVRAEFAKPYYRELSNFITAIQTGDESGICTGADAAHSIECCTQIADMLK